MQLHDLEQSIMSCWSVVEDIKALRQIQDSRRMTPDEQDSYLLGLETMYQVKFELLFEAYEQLIRKQSKNLP